MVDKTTSIQPRASSTRDITSWLWSVWQEYEEIPTWGSAGRTAKLREAAQNEPILSGALSSMVSKAVSLDWQITGGRNRTLRYQDVLAEAEDGQGWSYFLDRWLQDYLVADIGGVIELGRQGKRGPVVGLYNIDATCLDLTGNTRAPLRYYPKLASGSLAPNSVPLAPEAFARIVDLPSPDEAKNGLGFCAVSRALKAAKVLMALYNYDEERLSDMPLPGIVSITGMTMDEVEAAFAMYNARRESKQQTTFKGLLWLAAQSSPINPINVNFVPFSGLPEGFNRVEAVNLYVYTLALDFGVDVREFWPASQTGATKAEAEIQAQKARGKGFGRMLASVERAVNWHVLPEGLEFRFDQHDSEDDLLRETIRDKAIVNVRRLWEPTMGGPGIISTEEARRLLVEAEAAPDWLDYTTDETTVRGDANVPEEAQAPELETPAEEVLDAPAVAVEELAAKAQLGRGEDLVRVNRRGDVRVLWSSRRAFAVSNWPRPEAAQRPFSPRSLTTEYP